MVRHFSIIFNFTLIAVFPLSAQNKIKPSEVSFIKELHVYEANLRNHFIKIIRNERSLPSPDSVDYTFIITVITATKNMDSLSQGDFLSYVFLKKLKIANQQMSYESFFVNAFYTTKSHDTVFLTYSYPNAQLIGPKKISKQKATFFLSKVNDCTIRENARHVQFLNFCRENNISTVISILPVLSRVYCISKNVIYTVDNMNITSARPIE